MQECACVPYNYVITFIKCACVCELINASACECMRVSRLYMCQWLLKVCMRLCLCVSVSVCL